MGLAEIQSLLPHRYLMLLLDHVTEVVPDERIVATLAVGRDQQWYRELGAAAGEPAPDYPAVLLVESWCQAAALLGASSAPSGAVAPAAIPLLGGLRDVRLDGRVRPGDVIEHRVRMISNLGSAMVLDGASSVAGRPVLRVGRATVAARAPV